MTVRVDPEQNEIGALLDLVDLEGRRVLEIGSGDCRLTWRYADRAAHVTAVEPFAPASARAKDNLTPELARRVVLRRAAFGEFAAEAAASSFDVAIFSWSLCCMDQGEMVPALEEAHRLIGPSGTVIDIHPVAGTAEVEIHRAGKVVFAESASASDDEGSATQTTHSPPWSRAGGSSRNVGRSWTSVCTPRTYASCATSSRRLTRTRGGKGARRATRTSPSCTSELNG